MIKKIFTLVLICSFLGATFSPALAGGDTVNRHIFTGKEYDENTGLIYFGARYYDPDTARFITQDNFQGDVAKPPSLNRYLYAYSNPTAYTDPDGHFALEIGAMILASAAIYDYLFSDRKERVAEQLKVESTGGKLISNTIALTQSVSNTMTLGYFDAAMQPGGEGTAEYLKQRAGYTDYNKAYSEIKSPAPNYPLAALYAAKGAGETATTALLAYAAKGLTSRPANSLMEREALKEEAAVKREEYASGSRQIPSQAHTPQLTAEDSSGLRPFTGAQVETTGTNQMSNRGLPHWVDEGGDLRAGKSAGMSAEAYEYQSSVAGTRSNQISGRSQSPKVEYVDSVGNIAAVKFDGVNGSELIDRKLAIHTGPKTRLLARRQSEALSQNGLSGVWEVPNATAAARANKLLSEEGITNISVRLVAR